MNKLRPLLLVLTAVAALSVAYPAKANLITNPGFEGNLNGWGTTGPDVFATGTALGVAPHSGFRQVGSLGDSLFTFVATTPGASYTIDFWLANSTSPFPKSFGVSWDGATLLSLINQSNFGYTEYTFTGTASTASTRLEFDFFVLFQGGAWFLDDVSVNPASVPDAGSTLSLLGSALLAWLCCGANCAANVSSGGLPPGGGIALRKGSAGGYALRSRSFCNTSRLHHTPPAALRSLCLIFQNVQMREVFAGVPTIW